MPLSPIKRTVQFHMVAWMIVALCSCGLNEVPSIENRDTEPFQNSKCQNVLLRYGDHHLVSWTPQMGEPLFRPCSRANCYSGYEGVLAVARQDFPERAMVELGPYRLTPMEGQFIKRRPFYGVLFGEHLALVEGPTQHELTLFDGRRERIDRIPKPSVKPGHIFEYLMEEGERVWLITKIPPSKTSGAIREKHLLRDAENVPDIPLLDGAQIVGHFEKSDGWFLHRPGTPPLSLQTPIDVAILHGRVYGSYIFFRWEGRQTLEVIHEGRSFSVHGQPGDQFMSSTRGALHYQPDVGIDLYKSASDRTTLLHFNENADATGDPLPSGYWRESVQAFYHNDQLIFRERFRDALCAVEDRLTYLNISTGVQKRLASGQGTRAHLGFAGDAFRWVDMKTELNFVPFDG